MQMHVIPANEQLLPGTVCSSCKWMERPRNTDINMNTKIPAWNILDYKFSNAVQWQCQQYENTLTLIFLLLRESACCWRWLILCSWWWTQFERYSYMYIHTCTLKLQQQRHHHLPLLLITVLCRRIPMESVDVEKFIDLTSGGMKWVQCATK